MELYTGTADGFAANIANAHGFWYLGQFAADYRKLFGELPSKTRTNALLKLRS